MTKRAIANPLALAVLALLRERPMHPYEIATLLRQRHKHESVRLNYGSLYTVVDVLHRERLIVPTETLRDGRRPERTVYALTETGGAELDDWLSDLLGTPAKEYPQFAAGLSFMTRLPTERVVALLEDRTNRLTESTIRKRILLNDLIERGLPRSDLVETEYELAMQEAELTWVRTLADAIANGTVTWADKIRLRDGTLVWHRDEGDASKSDNKKEEEETRSCEIRLSPEGTSHV